MTALTLQNGSGQAATMSSKEMADLTEKRHDSVKRTIETLANQGVITLPQIEEVSNDGPGPKTIGIYRVGKRDSYIIVAQLSPEFTARLVDRWQELEEQARNPIAALSRLDLLKLAMDSEQERLKLESQVAAQAPKVQAFDRIATSDGSLCITDAAKTLQVQPRHLTKVLQEKNWVYRRPMGTGWLAYQDRIQAGLLEHKVTTGERGDGHEWSNTQVRITAKGLTKLAESLHQGGLH